MYKSGRAGAPPTLKVTQVVRNPEKKSCKLKTTYMKTKKDCYMVLESLINQYHEWMKSPTLQYLTSSEPLTLEEEFKMQKRWLEDEDKCTFIILDKSVYVSAGNEVDAMIGDTNLFLHESQESSVAEIEIMIANEASRGKKRGWESVILMLLYGAETLHVNKFCAKIKLDNAVSIRMFERLGFQEVERSEVFQEVTLEKEASSNWTSWLHSELQSVTPN